MKSSAAAAFRRQTPLIKPQSFSCRLRSAGERMKSLKSEV